MINFQLSRGGFAGIIKDYPTLSEAPPRIHLSAQRLPYVPEYFNA